MIPSGILIVSRFEQPANAFSAKNVNVLGNFTLTTFLNGFKTGSYILVIPSSNIISVTVPAENFTLEEFVQ